MFEKAQAILKDIVELEALGELNDNDEQRIKQLKRDFKLEIQDKSPEVLNQVDNEGNTLLHLAVKKESLFCVQHLLSRGADITQKNNAQNTAFHLAVQQGDFNIVDEMLGVSKKAKRRKTKTNLTDQNRTEKFAKLKVSQENTLKLLLEPDSNNEIPLIAAAKLKSDPIYKTLLLIDPAPGYTKKQLDTVYGFCKNRISGLKKRSFIGAVFESLCPSASMAEITESFAYNGLVAGAAAGVAFGLNIGFAALSVVGLGMITYANYKKNKAERNASKGLEQLQLEQAFLQNMRTRVKQIAAKPSLSADERYELLSMKNELNRDIPKPKLAIGNEKSAADYVTSKEKRLVALSSMGSFFCSYSGLLGTTGLGLSIAAEVIGTSLTALIVASGPIGIGSALAVGLLMAAGLGIYHYINRKKDYLSLGEQRATRINMESTIYTNQMSLRHGPDKILDSIQNLLNPEDAVAVPNLALEENKAEAQPVQVVKPTVAQPVQAEKTNALVPSGSKHGHAAGEICEIEMRLMRESRETKGIGGRKVSYKMPKDNELTQPLLGSQNKQGLF